MKKLISIFSAIFLLTLCLPVQQAAADRPSGPGGSSRGSHSPGGSYRGTPGHGTPSSAGGSSRGSHRPGGSYRGAPGHGTPSRGHNGHGGSYSHRPYGHRTPPRGYYPYRGSYRGYPGFGAFLPGLIVGGFLGWSLAPRYYYPEPYYYTPSPYYYPPPDSAYPPSGYAYPPATEGSQTPPDQGRMVIYPRQGQSQDQQERDHYDCHNWAVGQTDFDPTLPPPAGTPEAETARKSADYLRALEACLDAHGYTLK